MRNSVSSRLVIGLFGPAIFGSLMVVVFIFVPAGISEGLSIEMIRIALGGFVILLLGASFFIGLQSFLYTIVMEFIIRPRVRRRGAYLLASCMLGAVSGLAIDVIFEDHFYFSIFGLLTGFLTGLILYDKEVHTSNNKHMQSNKSVSRR
jgi:hypothetical protein